VAPPIDPTVATDVLDEVRFLYDGPSPVIKALDPIAVERRRVSVLSGRVLDSDGAPLAGTLVRVWRGTVFGYTYSRADGKYNVVVNAVARSRWTSKNRGFCERSARWHPRPGTTSPRSNDVALITADT
jgi:hypothetical protein